MTDEENDEGGGSLAWLAFIPAAIVTWFLFNQGADWLVIGGGFIFVLFGFWIVFGSLKINKQWEEAIILRLGKFNRKRKEGLFFVLPFIESTYNVNIWTQTLDIPSQEAITKDNISVQIDAVMWTKVIDSEKYVVKVEDAIVAVEELSKTTMRSVVGERSLDELLEKRIDVAKSIKEIVDKQADKWGMDIEKIELQNIILPEDMKRAFAVQAEAERESKAIKIKAQAEKDASKTLMEAGKNLKKEPIGLQLRILETLSDVSKDRSNTIIFALPTETLKSAGVGGLAAMASINSSAARARTRAKALKKKPKKKRKRRRK